MGLTSPIEPGNFPRYWRRFTSVEADMAGSPQAVVRPPFPVDAMASADLESALVEAIRRHDRSLVDLRKALRSCVWSLRDQQMSAENTILTTKALSRDTAAHHGTPRPGHPAALDHWMDDFVTWCIQDYFIKQ
jgi:hypothetical protein